MVSKISRKASVFTALVEGEINSSKIKVIGKGKRNTKSGLVNGKYTGTLNIKNWDSLIYSACLLTGYPSECKSYQEAVNPFQACDYKYDRVIEFQDELGTIIIHSDCKFNDSRSELYSKFEIRGNVNIPELESVESVVETWIPLSHNRIDGIFTMSWNTVDGKKIHAIAKSQYYLDLDPDSKYILKEVLHRFIDVDALSDPNKFELNQESKLFKTYNPK